jgi:hypothetical protein
MFKIAARAGLSNMPNKRKNCICRNFLKPKSKFTPYYNTLSSFIIGNKNVSNSDFSLATEIP